MNTFVELFFISVVFAIIYLFASCGIFGYVVAFLLFAFVVCFSTLKIDSKQDLSSAIVIPILLSAFQNIGLGCASESLSQKEVQVLTVLNFIYSLILCFLLYKKTSISLLNNDYGKKIVRFFIFLCAYCLFSIILLNSINVMSIVASFRNIVAMFLFFFIGALAADRVNPNRFENVLIVIGFIVICIGLFEILFYKDMWLDLSITDLWNKKGIRLQPTGLPTNFHSSETINGERIRRMTASFADPVNLGAFLFVIFTLSWFRNVKIMLFLTLIAIFLTVSKGALLGVLLFMCIYAFNYMSRLKFVVVAFFSALLGIVFLIYAAMTSATSVYLHMNGLLAAFESLPIHPLGFGIGSNGVLAKQFSAMSVNADITETGLGMIIAQLGLCGIVAYGVFFICCGKLINIIDDKRTKTLLFSLLFSIVANMFFNEVALSPNSCAAYFLIIGYYTYRNIQLRIIYNARSC